MDDAPEGGTGYLPARLGAQSRRRWARALAEHRLAPHHFAVMATLGQLGTAHQQRVSDLIGVDARNAVAVFDLLHARGLLSRDVDPGDRRRHLLTLTDTGAELLRRLRALARTVEDTMLAGLHDTDRAQLHELLCRLATALP